MTTESTVTTLVDDTIKQALEAVQAYLKADRVDDAHRATMIATNVLSVRNLAGGEF